MFRCLVAVTAAVALVALLAPAVLFSEPVSSVSMIVLGMAALVAGLALWRDESHAARRAGRILAVVGVVALAVGVGLFALLAFRGY